MIFFFSVLGYTSISIPENNEDKIYGFFKQGTCWFTHDPHVYEGRINRHPPRSIDRQREPSIKRHYSTYVGQHCSPRYRSLQYCSSRYSSSRYCSLRYCSSQHCSSAVDRHCSSAVDRHCSSPVDRHCSSCVDRHCSSCVDRHCSSRVNRHCSSRHCSFRHCSSEHCSSWHCHSVKNDTTCGQIEKIEVLILKVGNNGMLRDE